VSPGPLVAAHQRCGRTRPAPSPLYTLQAATSRRPSKQVMTAAARDRIRWFGGRHTLAVRVKLNLPDEKLAGAGSYTCPCNPFDSVSGSQPWRSFALCVCTVCLHCVFALCVCTVCLHCGGLQKFIRSQLFCTTICLHI